MELENGDIRAQSDDTAIDPEQWDGDIRAQSNDTAIDPEQWDGDIRAQSDDTLNVCRRILTTHIVFKMSVDSGSDEGVGGLSPSRESWNGDINRQMLPFMCHPDRICSACVQTWRARDFTRYDCTRRRAGCSICGSTKCGPL